MRLVIVDGDGEQRDVVWQSVETPADASDAIAGAGSQPLLAENLNRAGWFFQNCGAASMRVNELGADATMDGAIVIPPGGTFPPPGYPVTTTQINVSGTMGQKYSCREWSTVPSAA